jgi:lipid II:glycine glycyltransferase (peptidoglycan interpeptide bridge formation enzyme)
MCYVVMKRDISDDIHFLGEIQKGVFYDIETPYGYGGPLVDGEFSAVSQKAFLEELTAYCTKQNIVTQFLRFYPLLCNQDNFSAVSENRYMRDTIYIDTTSVDRIDANLDSKNRNMIRKASKNRVQIVERPIADYHPFLALYRETMGQHNADEYYLFDEHYFEYLKDAMSEYSLILYAMLDSSIISGAVFFFNADRMHYHLAGTHYEYRNLAAGNLLLYEAALWANKHGISKLHLGGGMVADDSLFGFKKQFNK